MTNKNRRVPISYYEPDGRGRYHRFFMNWQAAVVDDPIRDHGPGTYPVHQNAKAYLKRVHRCAEAEGAFVVRDLETDAEYMIFETAEDATMFVLRWS